MELIYTHLALTDEADLITCKLERSSSSGSGFVVKTDDGQAVDAFEYTDCGVELLDSSKHLEFCVHSVLTVNRPIWADRMRELCTHPTNSFLGAVADSCRFYI